MAPVEKMSKILYGIHFPRCVPYWIIVQLFTTSNWWGIGIFLQHLKVLSYFKNILCIWLYQWFILYNIREAFNICLVSIQIQVWVSIAEIKRQLWCWNILNKTATYFIPFHSSIFWSKQYFIKWSIYISESKFYSRNLLFLCVLKSHGKGDVIHPVSKALNFSFFSPRKSLVVAMAINMPVTQQAFWHHTHEMGFYLPRSHF